MIIGDTWTARPTSVLRRFHEITLPDRNSTTSLWIAVSSSGLIATHGEGHGDYCTNVSLRETRMDPDSDKGSSVSQTGQLAANIEIFELMGVLLNRYVIASMDTLSNTSK